ncbi:MAG: hypothetical protein SO135_03145 [Sphaerochaetaceae bacterium]|nr:hypothetical protein [Sphaerochaetaceae bacterium]NLY07877.1 hypothetical protein [Spirochaetales bacterium]
MKDKEYVRKQKIRKTRIPLRILLRENRKAAATYVILRFLVIAVLALQILNRNYENAFLCILTLVLFAIPSIIERRLHIDIPDTLEIIVLLFIFAAEVLGEMNSFYIKFRFWDTMLHTINGFLAAAIGFSLVDLLNRTESLKFKLSPFFLAVVAFCFSMTIGIVWEFFEFAMDRFIGLDMQKDTVVNTINTVMLDATRSNKVVSLKGITDVTVNGMELGLGGYLDIGLLDTMKDLIVNFIGAMVFSIIGYFFVKNRGKGFASQFIPRKLNSTEIADIEEQDSMLIEKARALKSGSKSRKKLKNQKSKLS